MDQEPELLRVSNGSDPTKVASAIAHTLYSGIEPRLRVIGASAMNQAIKACAIASGYAAPRGIRTAVVPSFTSIESRDGTITAMNLDVIKL